MDDFCLLLGKSVERKTTDKDHMELFWAGLEILAG